jgi:hypothetical protein
MSWLTAAGHDHLYDATRSPVPPSAATEANGTHLHHRIRRLSRWVNAHTTLPIARVFTGLCST